MIFYFTFFLTDAIASFYNPLTFEVYLSMSHYILPNYSLGFGVILYITYNCGKTETIPCHNAATARYIARSLQNNR